MLDLFVCLLFCGILKIRSCLDGRFQISQKFIKWTSISYSYGPYVVPVKLHD